MSCFGDAFVIGSFHHVSGSNRAAFGLGASFVSSSAFAGKCAERTTSVFGKSEEALGENNCVAKDSFCHRQFHLKFAFEKRFPSHSVLLLSTRNEKLNMTLFCCRTSLLKMNTWLFVAVSTVNVDFSLETPIKLSSFTAPRFVVLFSSNQSNALPCATSQTAFPSFVAEPEREEELVLVALDEGAATL